ncbi:MAG: ATP-grasp domain-containing protein [Spirochaetales bacterium]|nr:ATP-grasp domain-containing protein [Leptospiraceae bacterium]MCP5481013.1 ATP-grasp domain-containing protein [Spirochaetales bacterium]MCP5485393.1 ATP-grasp domain-containing protein [Spirochaetales bacterium]
MSNSPPLDFAPPRYFLSLGAGPNQVPLIHAARRLGYEVIAVDQDLRAPGFSEATIQVQCSILRPGQIIRLLDENLVEGQIVGVGCRSFGRANLSAALLSRHFATPGLRRSNLRFFRNKRLLKRHLEKNGLRGPRSYRWRSEGERDHLAASKGPWVARPVNGHGKLGVALLHDQDELTYYLEKQGADRGQALLEDYIQAPEITVMGMVHGGRFRTITITDKVTSQEEPLFVELKHSCPTHISMPMQKRVSELMQKIVDATRLMTGPIVAEFLWPDPSKDPLLVECFPETGGELLADELLPAAYDQQNYFEDFVRLHTGEIPVGVPTPQRPAHRVIIRFIAQREGLLEELTFPEEIQEHPGFLFARYLKRPGERTSLTGGNNDRLAVFALRAPLAESSHLDSEVESLARRVKIRYARP